LRYIVKYGHPVLRLKAREACIIYIFIIN